MKKLLFFVVLAIVDSYSEAQKRPLSKNLLTENKWIFKSKMVEFSEEKGSSVMKILPGAGKVIARDILFSNGIIEFDVKPNALSFFFRMKDEKENESFYFRTARAGNATAGDAVQYTPYIDGVNMWDMYGDYQSNALYSREEWNHVKLVISGERMRMFVNGLDRPVLEVGKLEGNTKTGKIAFEGDMQISNLAIHPDEVEGLSPLAEADPVHNDPRYIRKWAVSEPTVTPKNVDFSYDFMPDPDTPWRILSTERRGLLNLTRAFGESSSRRITWLKVQIKSAKEQKKKVDFGFGDDVWVFLNGQIAYVDKNLQGRPIAKTPEGRCSIENTSFILPLKEGENELLIGLANDFFGWGAIARLEDLDGLEVAPDPTFDKRLVKPENGISDKFTGTYLRIDDQKIMIAKEKSALRLSGDGFINTLIYPMGENRFFARSYELQIEFEKNANGQSTGLTIYNNTRKVLEAKRIE